MQFGKLIARRANLRDSRNRLRGSCCGVGLDPKRERGYKRPARSPAGKTRSVTFGKTSENYRYFRCLVGESSNGRTADSDSASLGSNPSSPATSSYFQNKTSLLALIFRNGRGLCSRPHEPKLVPPRCVQSCGCRFRHEPWWLDVGRRLRCSQFPFLGRLRLGLLRPKHRVGRHPAALVRHSPPVRLIGETELWV
jgi:hypothetical protein